MLGSCVEKQDSQDFRTGVPYLEPEFEFPSSEKTSCSPMGCRWSADVQAMDHYELMHMLSSEP